MYISSRSAKDCEATAEELNTIGPGKCIPLPADLQKLSEVERLVKELSEKENSLHVLVNNAGATWGETIDEYPVCRLYSLPSITGRAHPSILAPFHLIKDAAFTKVLTLNVQRVFTLTQKCLPLLRAGAISGGMSGGAFKDPARIINVGNVPCHVRAHIFQLCIHARAIDWISRGSVSAKPRDLCLLRIESCFTPS